MKEEMVDLLLAEPIGRIVACNILAALDEGLLTRTTIEKFMKNCIESFAEAPVRTTKELIGQFEDVARGDRPIGNGNRTPFLFACAKRTKAMRGTTEFSTITEVGTFKYRLVSDLSLTHGHASFVSNPDPTDPALKDAIDRLNGRNDIYRMGARLGGNPIRPLFWISPTKILLTERHRNSPEELGDAVRDLLGLIHYEENVPLVEIRIPCNRIQSVRHSRPTFADAGSNRRFKTISDGSLGSVNK